MLVMFWESVCFEVEYGKFDQIATCKFMTRLSPCYILFLIMMVEYAISELLWASLWKQGLKVQNFPYEN